MESPLTFNTIQIKTISRAPVSTKIERECTGVRLSWRCAQERIWQLGTFKVKDFKDCPKFGIEFSDFNAIFHWIQWIQCHFCLKNVILSYFQNLVSFDFLLFHIFYRVLAPEFIKTKIGNTSSLDIEKMDVKDLRYWSTWIQFLAKWWI